MGRGERETRGEHRGRGERLPSGSRFVFPVFLLLAALAAPASAQAPEGDSTPSGFTLSLRIGGVYSTRLAADDIGTSILPDTLMQDRFARDTIAVRMPIAPVVSLVAGLPLDETTELQLALGYTFGSLEIAQGSVTRDAGRTGVGQGVVSVRKPVRGLLARAGVGVLWFSGAEIPAIRDMRRLNPLLELGVSHAFPRGGFELEAGLVAQAAHVSSEAIEARGGPGGMVYRVALELGVGRRFGR